jgi:hypothetical protein
MMAEFDSAAFEQAADEAKEDFRKIFVSMTPEEEKGAKKVAMWFKAHYLKAGHKRLGRILVEIAKS